MTPEQARDLLPAIQAFAEGRDVQYQFQQRWCDEHNPSFNPAFRWRIKPERRKVWVHFPHDETPELGLMPPENGVCPRPNCKVVCVEEPES